MQDHTNPGVFDEEVPLYAAFGERFFAALSEGVILWMAGNMLGLLTGYSPNVFSLSTEEGFMVNLGDDIQSFTLALLYCAIMESGPWQATIGKRALGLKVTAINGDRISFLNAAGRYAGKVVSVLTLLIGYFMVLWDARHQALHDKMAGTIVVRNLNVNIG